MILLDSLLQEVGEFLCLFVSDKSAELTPGEQLQAVLTSCGFCLWSEGAIGLITGFGQDVYWGWGSEGREGWEGRGLGG